ncbi:helicase [Prevotella sp. oral taxon 820]|nr:helicase [Prevotella sp. oral taxon 820]
MKIEAVIAKLGIKLNRMQEEVYKFLNQDRGQDLILLSPTGSGKTLAYLLPILNRIDQTKDSVQCIVVVPGRELAIQSSEVLAKMGTGHRSCACYGGRPTMDEHRVIRKVQPSIVFGTPGRLIDHIVKENIDTTNIHYIVLDEYDKCLEMGFREEIVTLLSYLPNNAKHILLSATRYRESDISPLLTNYKQMDYLPKADSLPSKIELFQVNSPDKDKLDCLLRLLLYIGEQSSIIFLNYRDSVVRVADFLHANGFSPTIYHGGLDQNLREESIYKFMNGSTNILVCTDLGSRGLDIPNVQNIINYHLPESSEAFVHRIGRTARWDAEGRGFLLLGPEEAIPAFINSEIKQFVFPGQLVGDNFKIEDYTIPQAQMVTLYIGKGKKHKISKGDIVGFFCKQCGLHADKIGRIDVYEYFSLVAINRKEASGIIQKAQGQKIKGIKTIIEQK